MPSQLKVPVEVPVESETSDDPDQLSIKINQIFLQKGPFRNVTEQSIALEPDTDGSESEADDKADHSDDETREERLELLTKTRQELFDTIRRGTLQCNEALDFISLLLSKHSRAAVSTFSPALKEAVEPGTLEGLYLDNARYAPTIRPKQDLGKGWRTQGFVSAAEKLRIASKRVKREADGQSSFWAQVAEVGDDGWKVCRHPRNRRQLGVFFAMPESAPQFRSEGFATLRQDGPSSIQLDKRSSKKRVSVTISRSGKVTGRHAPDNNAAKGKSELLQELTEARDCLVDEELFHELGREARLAANQGITTRGEDIEFSINDEFSVAISLQTATESRPSSSSEDDDLAMFVALALRSLLNHAHYQNYNRRSQPPPPISTRPTHTPEPAMLRPVIAMLRQKIAKLHVEKQMEQYIAGPLHRAGIDIQFSYKDGSYRYPVPEDLDEEPVVPIKIIWDDYTVSTPVETFAIRVQAYLGRPLYGIEYEIGPPWETFELWTTPTESFTVFYDFLRALKNKVLGIVDRIIAQSPHDGRWQWKADDRTKGVYATLEGDTMPAFAVKRSLNGRVLTASVHVGHAEGEFVASSSWDTTFGLKEDPIPQPTLVDFVNETVRTNSDEIKKKAEKALEDDSDSDASETSDKGI